METRTHGNKFTPTQTPLSSDVFPPAPSSPCSCSPSLLLRAAGWSGAFSEGPTSASQFSWVTVAIFALTTHKAVFGGDQLMFDNDSIGRIVIEDG